MLAALDSSVVSAALRRADALHEPARSAVESWEHDGGRFQLSVVAWAEILTGALRIKRPGTEDSLSAFRKSVIDDLAPVDLDIATEAARLRSRAKGLRMPDALIIATAQVRGADVLLTGDRRLHSVAPDLVQVVS